MNELNLINKDRMYMMIFLVISSSVIIKICSWLKTYAAVMVMELLFN